VDRPPDGETYLIPANPPPLASIRIPPTKKRTRSDDTEPKKAKASKSAKNVRPTIKAPQSSGGPSERRPRASSGQYTDFEILTSCSEDWSEDQQQHEKPQKSSGSKNRSTGQTGMSFGASTTTQQTSSGGNRQPSAGAAQKSLSQSVSSYSFVCHSLMSLSSGMVVWRHHQAEQHRRGLPLLQRRGPELYHEVAG
jgi:hypothetical protein